ncbi:Glycine betaine/proline/ectoine/pipecolic acid transporter OusA [Seminavis robusta]|uniref:Glycine betaine/proline/ectoine/pipecolic acid transporter OusA n=1 Tax=Seminavis robusta TaxID=568900 RepID=A0A9N8DC40_9STRA|nr:Glycine betaine/proline/ectoine/pipecolic acid transporter OusA [Seminavis robusta]|eukprot:Sro30_g019860.1 Glycine betaine/proline/ectoine/pipecolic acid transporter OusA (536) ;mRNA; r:141674-143548
MLVAGSDNGAEASNGSPSQVELTEIPKENGHTAASAASVEAYAGDEPTADSNGGPTIEPPTIKKSDFGNLLAGTLGNTLEWYDFALFGFLSDVIGGVFFPSHQQGHMAITESFLVFGVAFLFRPIGGVVMGYIGDKYGRRKALIISIYCMAFPTFAMGCLPSYERVGDLAIVLLVLVRLLQGFSVGGQLMASAVFTLEGHDRDHWGYYGSLVMATANFGTLLGSFAGWALRSFLTDEQLSTWGWRIPFLSGILVSFSGLYLKGHELDDDHGTPNNTDKNDGASPPNDNPLKLAFARHNLRSLLAASMVPMLWSSGFYLSFVWMAIFMADLIDDPVPGSFGVNAGALFFSVCLLFPIAGMASDRYGRRIVMTVGGLSVGILCPFLIVLIGRGNTALAFASQTVIGISLSCWGAPMIAWLVESFEPEARLTSVAIGYNLAVALIGGLTPALATFIVDSFGPVAPGFFYPTIAVVSLTGLWFVAPSAAKPMLVASDDEAEAGIDGGHTRSNGDVRRRQKKEFSAVPNDECVPDDLELI